MAEGGGTAEDVAGGAGGVQDVPGRGHNQPEVVWERWQKKRTFVRALEGTYGDLMSHFMDVPRVYSSHDKEWKGGPQMYGKHTINPQKTRSRVQFPRRRMSSGLGGIKPTRPRPPPHSKSPGPSPKRRSCSA